MGTRGPAATPTSILKARGSREPDRYKNAPKAAAIGEPDRPAGLKGEAANVWATVVPLIPSGVLSRDNGQMLARYCTSLVRFWKLEDWRDSHDDIYSVTDQFGNVRYLRHPNVITHEKLLVTLLRMEQEMGVTPATRDRIAAIPEKKNEQEGKARFFPGPRLAQTA